ncbi:hypothetical protein CI238_13243, partial [Colletotrichum incanum]
LLPSLPRLDNLLKGLNQDIGVVLLEDKHRPQAHGALAGAANVDAQTLGLLQKLVAAGVVKGDEGALALAAQVGELARVLGRQALELAEKVVADAGRVLDEAEALDLLDDGAEEDGARRVAHPGVELAVGLVGAELRVAEVVAGRLGLLGEGDHVGRRGEVPVLVGPELAGGADAGLDLVDDEEDVVLLGHLAEAAEEGGRCVVVAALGLDRLDDDGGGRDVVVLDEVLDLVEGGLLGGGVLLGVLLERVLEEREGGLGPVEGGDVELVDGLGAGRRQGAKEAAVEARAEGEDGEVGRSRGFVVHGRRRLLGGEVDVVAAALLLAAPHEGGLVGGLVGVGAGHGREDLVEPLGRHLEDSGAEDLGPVLGRKVAERGAVDDGVDHLGGLGHLGEGGVVVAQGDGGDLGVDVKQDVAVGVDNVVALALLVVREHVQAPRVEHLVQVLGVLLGRRARDLGLERRAGGLAGEEARGGHARSGGAECPAREGDGRGSSCPNGGARQGGGGSGEDHCFCSLRVVLRLSLYACVPLRLSHARSVVGWVALDNTALVGCLGVVS